jgi:putative oxidoreductase
MNKSPHPHVKLAKNNIINHAAMTLKHFLFPAYYDESRAYSTLLLVIRIFFGILFLIHGYDKFMSYHSINTLFNDPLGIGSSYSLMLTIFAELICSFALIFGILQRLVLIPMIITMCVAFFVVHGADAFSVKELSFIYLITFVLLFITGPGQYSFDSLIGRYIQNREAAG